MAGFKEVGNDINGGPMNRHKMLAMGKSIDTGEQAVSKHLGGKPPRSNPNRGMSHMPISDSNRACKPPVGRGNGSMSAQCCPDHGPQYS